MKLILTLCLAFVALPSSALAISLDAFIAENSTTIEIEKFRDKHIVVSSQSQANILCSHLGFLGGAASFTSKPVKIHKSNFIWVPTHTQYMGASAQLHQQTVLVAGDKVEGVHSCHMSENCSVSVISSITCLKAQIVH